MASVFGVLEQSEVTAHGPEEIAQCKGLLRKREDLSLTHRPTFKKKMVHDCNHSSGEVEMRRSLEMTEQPA